jgi:hypothetical protein
VSENRKRVMLGSGIRFWWSVVDVLKYLSSRF